MRALLPLLGITLALLVACGDGEESRAVNTATASVPASTATPEATLIHGTASIDTIDILELESFPVQIVVTARGNLPDGCTQIDRVDVTSERDRSLFRVEITTVRERDKICTQALVPFERSIRLDVYGLPAGTYTVDVNGVVGSFTLTQDNVL